MIVQNLRLVLDTYGGQENPVLDVTIEDVIARYEKLMDDISAAAAIDGNERVLDLIEEEMEEG